MFSQVFGLIDLILEIIVRSAVYTTIIFIVFYFLSKKSKWVEKRMEQKTKNWLLLHFLISLVLFIFSFSYWQDTGLGDNPQLPVGYGQIIYSPDFEWTEFYPDLEKTQRNKDELQIENFIIKDNVLCAEVSHKTTDSPKFDFIICDLPKKANKIFNKEQDYIEYATKNNLPLKDQFFGFKKHYNDYFANKSKWRKWFLP